MRCDWCQKMIHPGQEWKEVDHILLHSNNQTADDPKPCEQHYRDYCRHIKSRG